MRNSTFKILMMACILFIAGYSNGQLRIETNAQNGSEVTIDTEGAKHWIYHFNTTQQASSVSVGLKSFRNRNGYQANVYDDTLAVVSNGNRFNMPKYSGGANICHWESLDSLNAYLAIPDGGRDTLLPSTGLFDVADGDAAFGTTPGKYKKVELAFCLGFAGYGLDGDVTFDILTYDAGKNLGGATASYDLEVYIGTDPNSNTEATPDATVADFYVTGSGTKNVSLAAATGLNTSDFANQKVYVFLKTTGSGTAIADDVRDPMIVIDNIAAKLLPAIWKAPAIAENQIGNNEKDPLVGIIGEESVLGIPLKIKGRYGAIEIADNLYLNGVGNKSVKPFTFLDTLAVMAKDENGDYTVEVDYTLTPATFNNDNKQWSTQKIVVAAPDSGAVDDDIMFYFKAEVNEEPYSARLELNCGTRIWYDIFVAGAREWNISSSEFNALGTIASDTTINGLTIYSANNVTVDANNKSIDGMDFTHRLKLGGSGAFVDGTPDYRVLAFDVSGNTTITIAGMSSSSSEDRKLVIAAGSESNVIDTFQALGSPISKADFNYIGGPTTIYLYSINKGVNVYYLKSSPMTRKKVAYITMEKTMADGAASVDDDPVIRMLKADPLFNVDVMVVADDAQVDLNGYGVVVVQETFGSSSPILKPGGSLALQNIKVPFIYNKAYALRDGKAVTSATSAATKEIAGQLYLEVPEASQASKLFSGITFDGDSVMIFKTGASDDGSEGSKAFSYTVDLEMSNDSTLLGMPKGATENVSVCLNDIPAGTVLGTMDTLQARMIHISQNFGAMCKDNGTNLTSEGLTIWRNALYMAAGLTPPATLFEDVATLDTLYATLGALSPDFDAQKTGYQLNLPSGTSSVNLMATASSDLAMLTVPGKIFLSDGSYTEAAVEVISPLGSDTMTYKVYIHVQAEEEILYVSNSDGVLGTTGVEAMSVYDAMVGAGYSVTLEDKLAINTNEFDYSPYSGVVIGAGVGSSWVNGFAIQGYPLPCVTMQHDGPRSGKWGWVNTDKDDNTEMNVVKTSASIAVDSAKMQILNNTHYITEGFEMGELVTWQDSSFTNSELLNKEVKSYNLSVNTPSAVALGRIPMDGSALTNWWAVPRGSVVKTRGADGSYTDVTLTNRIVVMTVFTEGLMFATEAFDTMMVRSLDWVMGEGPTTGVIDAGAFSNSRVVFYPNPARETATLRFTMERMDDVNLSVYNLVGQKMRVETPSFLPEGQHEIQIRTGEMNDGMYIYVLQIGDEVHKGKFNVMK